MTSQILRAPGSREDRGATAAEYGLLVAAIAAVVTSTVFGFGHTIGITFHRTYTSYSCATATGTGPHPPGCPGPGRSSARPRR